MLRLASDIDSTLPVFETTTQVSGLLYTVLAESKVPFS